MIRVVLAILGVVVSAPERQPLDVARLLAARYPENISMSYIPALSWSGAIRLTLLTGEARWREKAQRQLHLFVAGEKPSIAEPYQLASLAGHSALFDLGDVSAARKAADFILATEHGDPVRFARGWTDDMFFASALLSRIGNEAPEGPHARAAGALLTSYASALQRPDGLFVHAADAPHAWGRGNGFAALGLVEALTHLPERWPFRSAVLEIYRRHMRALARHQSDDGAWRQVVDEPASYRELTVTAMTVAAMARGVRLGWLEGGFTANIDKGWHAVAARISDGGSLRDVCAGTAAGATKEYYLNRPAINGADDRGGAMALLAALEVEELARKTPRKDPAGNEKGRL